MNGLIPEAYAQAGGAAPGGQLAPLLMMVLSCGLMFQLPMVILMLAKAGIAGPGFLRAYRRHAIIVIVIVAAILTPSPDLFSLLIVACPIYLLYELSILLAARAERQNALEG